MDELAVQVQVELGFGDRDQREGVDGLVEVGEQAAGEGQRVVLGGRGQKWMTKSTSGDRDRDLAVGDLHVVRTTRTFGSKTDWPVVMSYSQECHGQRRMRPSWPYWNS